MRTTLLGGLAIVVLGSGCAAMHRQTVENMRAKGDPRADCYEACGPSGVVCMKECDNKHPWAGTIFQGSGRGGAAPASLGPTASGGAGDNGGASTASPVGTVDAPAQQPPPGGVTAQQIEMLTAAALQDAARRKGASTTSTSSASMSSSSSSSSSASPSTNGSRSSSSTGGSSTSCSPACGGSQKCVVYLQGSKQCAPGGKCWTVDRTHAECK